MKQIFFLIVVVLSYFTTQLNAQQLTYTEGLPDYSIDLRKVGSGIPFSIGGLFTYNGSTSRTYEIGKIASAPTYAHGVYQWNINDSEIPYGSTIHNVTVSFNYSIVQYQNTTINYFNCNYDIADPNLNLTALWNSTDILANPPAEPIGEGIDANLGWQRYVKTAFDNGSDFVNEFTNSINQNGRFTLGIAWKYEGPAAGVAYWNFYAGGLFPSISVSFTPPNQSVILDQKLSNGTQVGELRKWEGSEFTDPPFAPGTAFNFPVNSTQTILGDQNIISNQKYYRWTRNQVNESDVLNHHSFTIQPNDFNYTSQFNPTQQNITIKNSLENSATDGGQIEFRDPWLIDYPDPAFGNQLRNRGMNDALFYSRTSPFYPDYTTSYNGFTYKGVFLNQGTPNWTPPYYKVKALQYQDINLGGSIGTRRFYFQNWSGMDAQFQYPNALETGVVFTSSNAVANANHKGTGLSNQSTAYNSNSQRKSVRLGSGALLNLYESLGNIYIEKSYDNGQSWYFLNSGANPFATSDNYSTPSIDWIPWMDAHSFAAVVSGVNGCQYYTQLRVDVINESQSFSLYSKILNSLVGADTPPPLPFTPVIAVTQDKILLVCNSGTDLNTMEEGLVYFYGTISHNGYYVNINWVNEETPLKIQGSTRYSKNPTIAADKDGNTFHIAWQDGNDIKYLNASINGNNISFSPLVTPSSGTGYTQNYSPSILVMETDNLARLCWIGKRYVCEVKDPTIECAGSFQYKVLFKGLNNLGRYWAFGGGNGDIVSSPNINKKNDNTTDPYYAFGWYESSGVNKFADNTLSTVRTLNTTGQQLQIVNGQNKDNMYAMSFNYSSVPYYFQLSNNLGSFYSLGKTQYIAFNSGREGVVSIDSAGFYFALGDIQIDGQPVDFVEIADTVPVNTLAALNEYMLSEPIAVSDNCSFVYSVQYGINDSLSAALAMVENRFLRFKVQLVDNSTGQVIGTYDNVEYNSGNIYNYGNISYQVNTQGIGNRTVRLKLIVDNNFAAEYSMGKIYSDESVLGKTNIQQINFRGNNPVTTYNLFQNYPNPFNPNTTIKFEIPDDGLVTLKVYDILGAEVATLINEEKTVGRYEVNFDASKLASGVYIYQLQVNDFINMKKMILLK